MNLADLLHLLDINPHIDELKIYGDKSGRLYWSLSTGAFSQVVNKEHLACFVNHWLIFGDGDEGYTITVEIEED